MSPSWRPMHPADLPEIERIGSLIHPDYPEDAAVFEERLALDPAGCFVLADGAGRYGYAVSHRWRLGSVPALNTLLRALPPDPDTRHVHDVALLPGLRGAGHGSAIVAVLADLAAKGRPASLSLVAVGPSRPFWSGHGFVPAATPVPASYGDGAVVMVRPAP